MVRLKVIEFYRYVSQNRFQFLMVRLKAVALANQKWLKIWLYD